MTQPYNSDISRNCKFPVHDQHQEAVIELAEPGEHETFRDGEEIFTPGWLDNLVPPADPIDDLIAYAVNELGAVVAEPDDVVTWDGQEWHKYGDLWVRIL